MIISNAIVSSRKKSLILCLLPFCIFFVILWICPVGVKKSIKEAFVNVQAPIYSFSYEIKDIKYDARKRSVDHNALLNEYSALLRKNFYLQVRINELLNLSAKKPINDCPSLEDQDARFVFIHAAVIRRDLVTWAHCIVINKGKRDGVKIGDGVISKHNVVGKIKEVYDKSAVVELLSSPTFRMSACFEHYNFPIIYRGTSCNSLSKYSGIAENIISEFSKIYAEYTDKIHLVSSYLNDIFPGGLTIGYVSNIANACNDVFFQVKVNLDANFINALCEVVVLSKP